MNQDCIKPFTRSIIKEGFEQVGEAERPLEIPVKGKTLVVEPNSLISA